MNFLNTSIIFTTEVFILCKKVWRPRRPGAVNFDILVAVCLPGFVPFGYWTVSFLERLAREIEIKNRSAERLLPAMRTFIMLNVSLAKTEWNAWWVLSSFPQNYTKTSNISKGWNFGSYIWQVFVSLRCFEYTYFFIFLKSKYSTMWYSSWLLTVYFFL